MPALMRPNPVRANLQAGGNVYGGDSSDPTGVT
jgi:hypothetical protein